MNSLFHPVFSSLIGFKGAAQLAHWNIVGKDFYQLHKLFERVYETLDSQVDPFAEQLRGLGIEIPAAVFNQVPDIDWTTGRDLVQWLLNLCLKYRSDLTIFRAAAEQENQFGFINIIEGFLSDVNTLYYLLNSTLEG